MDLFLYILLIFIAFGGFLLAFYIRHKKRSKEKLVCPVGANCDLVVHSEYSRFLGLPIEILGMCYYASIALFYAAVFVFHHSDFSALIVIAFGMSTLAFLFSVYLTFIQAFTLKQWCTWCLTSAVFCTLIFLVSFNQLHFGPALFKNINSFVGIVHIFSVSLGVGGATIAETLVLKFLKDFRISEWEASVLKNVSQIIWFALGVLIISGFAFFLSQPVEFYRSPEFIVKAVSVILLIINGALLNLVISPRLILIFLTEGPSPELLKTFQRLRRWAFLMGVVSLVSWYTVFILTHVADSRLNLPSLLGVYAFFLFVGGAASQVVERRLRLNGASPTASK